jgi:DNA mismatch endonuclease (patch repair protein)
MKSLASGKYRRTTTLREENRRGERYWVNDDGDWSIIKQSYKNVHDSAGQYVLIHKCPETRRWRSICSLHSRTGPYNREVLAGREGGGADWLCARDQKLKTDLRQWRLLLRGRSRPNGNRDELLDGRTTGSRLERILEAAFVTLDIAYDQHPDIAERPDFVLPHHRVAVFAHGCRQHAHGCHRGKAFGRQLSEREARDIRRHDREMTEHLARKGWRTCTVWECAAARDYDGVRFVTRLQRALDGRAGHTTIAGAA